MERSLKMYDLAASPNSIKVRTALGYKKLAYERVAVDPANREALVKMSGQPLAPVLVHGDTVVYDSYAITRYIDANFPGTPRLYSADREAIKAIETWELFGRNEPGPAVSMMFGQLRLPAVEAEKVKRANEIMNRAASRVEETLSEREWLVGSAPTAADCAIATMLYMAVLPESALPGPVGAFFRKHLAIPGSPKTKAWIGRVMAWDRQA
jgi:glutathione S-transferase